MEGNDPDSSMNISKSNEANESYFKAEEIGSKPVFMRKILERKNLMYKLMFEAEDREK